jgi:hypothetical protein
VSDNTRLEQYTFMRISACPVLLVLFALVSGAPKIAGAKPQARLTQWPAAEIASISRTQKTNRPILQSPQTVNVRPRVATQQPGIPTVKATANRRRVPLGDMVTFTLSPASVISDPRYTVTILFGDGKQERIRQTQINHLYTSPGTFTYSILVESSEPSTTIPDVKLSATPTSVKPDDLVSFKAELSHNNPNVKYRFVFADGSPTYWQDSSVTTHRYRPPGTYRAYVDIGFGNSRSAKQISGSRRVAIEVTSQRPETIAVRLTANRLPVQAKDEVTFLAHVDPTGLNLTYRFAFGDRSRSTEWQISPQAKHVYVTSGTYPASVEVRVMNNRSGQRNANSGPLSIKVGPEPLTGVDLFIAPPSVPIRFPVYFKAIPDSANSKTRYRFNFGDGSPFTAWKKTLEDWHIYLKAGNYPAFVEITGGPNERVASSRKKQVTVTAGIPPEPTNEPTPWEERPTPLTGTPTPLTGGVTPTPGGPTPPTGGPTPTTTTPTPTTTPDGSPTPSIVLTSSPTPDATASPSATASPTPPTNSDSSDSWWKYVLVGALILFGGYQGWKYFFAPIPTLEPHVDPGSAALGTEGGPLGINFQMELDPNVTDGEFKVDTTEGSLIKSERKSNG